MEICCRTCKHFRNNECYNEEMVIKRESIEAMVEDIFLDLKEKSNEVSMRGVVAIIEEAVLTRVSDVNFTPPDYEFRCKFYE